MHKVACLSTAWILVLFLIHFPTPWSVVIKLNGSAHFHSIPRYITTIGWAFGAARGQRYPYEHPKTGFERISSQYLITRVMKLLIRLGVSTRFVLMRSNVCFFCSTSQLEAVNYDRCKPIIGWGGLRLCHSNQRLYWLFEAILIRSCYARCRAVAMETSYRYKIWGKRRMFCWSRTSRSCTTCIASK